MVLLPVSSHGTSAFLEKAERVGFPQHPVQQLQHGALFRGFRRFQLYLFNPPDLLTTQVASTAVVLCPPGSCGVYIQAGHVLLPPHELDMLAA